MTLSFSSVGVLTLNLLTEACWGVMKAWGKERKEREHWYLSLQTELLCPGMSRWWIWLALGWQRHIRRKARTPQHSPLSLFSNPFHESLLLSLSLSPLTQHIHSAVLISMTCPHLSACRGDNNMGLVCGWVQGVWMDEVHNQGNKHFIPLL